MLRGISEHFWLGDGNTLPSPVVRKVEIAIHRINLYPVLNRIRWIVIYPADSVIRLNNRGLDNILETEFSICQSYSLYVFKWNARKKKCFLFMFKPEFPETLGIKWKALIVLAVFLAEASEWISVFHKRVSLNLENSRLGPTAIK